MVVAMASFLFVGCLPVKNQAPIITSDPVKTAEVGVDYTYDVNATDPEEDVLTYSLTTKPSGMNINPATGLIGWTPIIEGDVAVVVMVSDGDLDTIQSFTIVVSELEPEPEPELVLVGIAVKPKTMELVVGGEKTITSVTACYEVRGYGVDIDLTDCLFLTSNKDIATVDGNGLVTAVAEGTANILVSYGDKFDTLVVTVTHLSMEIKVDMPEFEVDVGGTCTEGFIVEVVANSDVGKLVKFYFKFPEGIVELDVGTAPTYPNYTIEIFEETGWLNLLTGGVSIYDEDTDEYALGGETGDLLIDEFRIFKATFTEAKVYTTTVEVRTYPDDELLCSKVITANVFPAIPEP